jgi:RHS repeat-associated protein
VTRFAQDGWGTGGGAAAGQGNANWQVLADLNSSNQLQTRYIRGDVVDQLFARMSSGGTAAWYLTDDLGSVRQMTDGSGVLQDTIAYDAYGSITSESSSTFGDRYKFTGREWDAETGLQYNRARYYDPKTGRWTSQDPLGFDAGDSNLYRYVTNTVLEAADPSGLSPPASPFEFSIDGYNQWRGNRPSSPAEFLKYQQHLDLLNEDRLRFADSHIEANLRYLLEKTEIGRLSLKYLKDHPDKKLWLTPYIEYDRINVDTRDKKTFRISGLTTPDDTTAYIAKETYSGRKSAIDIAAAIVHEITHMKGVEAEYEARQSDITFRKQLEKAGVKNAMLQLYIDEGVVSRKDGEWVVSGRKLSDLLKKLGYNEEKEGTFRYSEDRFGPKSKWLQLFKTP